MFFVFVSLKLLAYVAEGGEPPQLNYGRREAEGRARSVFCRTLTVALFPHDAGSGGKEQEEGKEGGRKRRLHEQARDGPSADGGMAW